EKAFPGIRVDATIAPSNDIFARLQAERTARKYIPDVLAGVASSGSTLLDYKGAGVMAPLKPALILPEVVDDSAWFERHLWWIDATEPFTTLSFQGVAASVISYNTKLVDPREFTSYQDLLQPKWKGQIVSTDIRQPGSGGTQALFL